MSGAHGSAPSAGRALARVLLLLGRVAAPAAPVLAGARTLAGLVLAGARTLAGLVLAGARTLAGLVLGRARPLAAPLVRRARGRRAVAALVAVLAVVLGAVVAVGLGGHPARTGPTVPRAALVPGYGTRAARWLGGPAGHLLSAVNADLGRLAVAERSGKRGQARQAGLRLSADAKAALLGPAPPLGGRLYRAALAELERAGRSAAAGRRRAAAAGLLAGESTITKATALANSPATSGLRAAPVSEPGQ